VISAEVVTWLFPQFHSMNTTINEKKVQVLIQIIHCTVIGTQESIQFMNTLFDKGGRKWEGSHLLEKVDKNCHCYHYPFINK
jgi:hypothetical protein